MTVPAQSNSPNHETAAVSAPLGDTAFEQRPLHYAPMKEPAIRTRAMPKDTNSAGDIWGGWLLAQMDLAGEAAARERTKCRVVTVAVDAMEFLRPVKVGDVVSFYADVVVEGRTSLVVEVRAIANSEDSGTKHRVTEGRFTFVAIGPDGQPQNVDPAQRSR